MIHKFLYEKDKSHVSHLPYSYESSAIVLDYCGYLIERDKKVLITSQDIVFPQEFPSLYMPADESLYTNCAILFATAEDVLALQQRKIPIVVQKDIGTEYFYTTDSIINLTNSALRRARQFSSGYHYSLLYTYDRVKIVEFYNFWKSQKNREQITFDGQESFFMFCLENLERYHVRQVYVEVNGKLVGFAWGVLHQNGGWVGLHLKVDYTIKGLSRFLQRERARLFSDTALLTLGSEARVAGIQQYKEELGPIREQKYYYLLTGPDILGA